jgi:hypothetical protein
MARVLSLNEAVSAIETYRTMDWDGKSHPLCRLHASIKNARTVRSRYALTARALIALSTGARVGALRGVEVDFDLEPYTPSK